MQHFQHRHIFDALEQQPIQDEVHQDDESLQNIEVFHEEITLLHRNDVDPNIIQANIVQRNMRENEQHNEFIVDDSGDEEDTLGNYCSRDEDIV